MTKIADLLPSSVKKKNLATFCILELNNIEQLLHLDEFQVKCTFLHFCLLISTSTQHTYLYLKNIIAEIQVPKITKLSVFDICVEILTSIDSITKEDAKNLLIWFKTLRNVLTASYEDLVQVKNVSIEKAHHIINFMNINYKFLTEN